MSYLKYFLAWFPMVVLAIMNGALRDLVYTNYLGDLAARQISTLSLLLIFAIYIYFVIKKFPPLSLNQAMYIGILWCLMTLLFEFGFGLYGGNSWEKLLEDYNIFKGRLWVLVPIWLCLAPAIFYKVNRQSR
ncbi:hypothetical protein [Solitalea canadensis]|nr:hypothetical protein [Solitalea canadensis]